MKDSEEYYLGVFLVGAYQETLGDLHNLLGDTNVVTIRIQENGKFDFVGEQEGDTVADILSYVEYDPKRLFVASARPRNRRCAPAGSAPRNGGRSSRPMRRVYGVYVF